METEIVRQIDRRKLWWLASYPKSGSTWVRMFINTYITGFDPDINAAWQYVTGDLQPTIYQMTAAHPVTEMTDIDSFYYRPAVLMNHILMSHTPDKTLKTHNAKLTVDDIPLIPPKLTRGALYIIRDPRDVAPSFANHLGVTVDEAIEKMGNPAMTLEVKGVNLFHVLSSWAGHVDSWTIHNTDVVCGVVRYEDLLERPEESWPSVLKVLGLDIDEKKMWKALERTQFSRLQKQEEQKGFQENGNGPMFFRRGQAGGWKDTLTDEQVLRIETDHRHTMTRFEYELVNNLET